MTPTPGLSRRGLIGGTLAVAGAVTLPACGGGATGPAGPTDPTDTGTAPGTELARLAEVPDGGGTVVNQGGRPVVLSRTGSTVTAFDGRCPHQGATVAAPTGGEIVCPLHRSRFRAGDGSLIAGPATTGLTPVAVTVSDGAIVTG